MAHRFIAKTFIRDATVGDHSVSGSPGNLPNDIEEYLEDADAGGSSQDLSGSSGERFIAISSCKLSGDRTFTIVVAEDQYGGG